MWKICGIMWATVLVATAGDMAALAHPRLWLPQAAMPALREKIAKDPLAADLQAVAMKRADHVLKERTCKYELSDGKRLLSESRRALGNVMSSAWAWRFTGEEKYRLRTIAELNAACEMQSWHPPHFLDTAEMAAAVAIGYDWLYPTLTPEQRTMCEQAIIEKALKPAKHLYDTGGWWTKGRNNWSQVCGSGIALAAAAVAGHDDGLSQNLFDHGVALIEKCSKFYEPDGLYPEGPGYFHYGTNYEVMLLAACQEIGYPVKISPFLRKGGDAIMRLVGPTRLPFNFADGHAHRETPSPDQCWIATEFKDAAQAHYVRDLFARALKQDKTRFSGGNLFPLAILWLPPLPTAAVQTFAKSAVFRGEQAVATFRTGWGPDAAWFAIKGGTPAASHGHMDVGSFCYDAHGLRWIDDLGSDNYNLPDYFGSKRFTYYRLQNRSHNTLEIGGRLQNANSKPCPLTDSSLKENFPYASFDLTNAYADTAKKVQRAVRFDPNTGVTRIEDTITDPVGDVVWRAFTDAQCEVKGDRVILTKSDQQISLRLISSVGTWTVTDANPPTPEENQNVGFRAAVLTVPKAARIYLVVEIQP